MNEKMICPYCETEDIKLIDEDILDEWDEGWVHCYSVVKIYKCKKCLLYFEGEKYTDED